jgi:hypothetical protein
MIRVHLTAKDLLRVKFATQPAPLIELGHSLAALQRRDPALARLPGGGAAAAAADPGHRDRPALP